MMRLGQASKAEQDAAAKAVHDDVVNLIENMMSSGFASMFKEQAKQKLESPEGRRLLLAIVDHGLAAAEKVRQSAGSPEPVKPHD